MVVFDERGTGVPGENVSEQSKESTNATLLRFTESNPGHLGEKGALTRMRMMTALL